jgi:uncharacterized protein YhhL (DUF1145 family)
MTTSVATNTVKRSTVYHLLNTIAPTNHKLKAELDVLGSLIILVLAFGLVILVSVYSF